MQPAQRQRQAALKGAGKRAVIPFRERPQVTLLVVAESFGCGSIVGNVIEILRGTDHLTTLEPVGVSQFRLQEVCAC